MVFLQQAVKQRAKYFLYMNDIFVLETVCKRGGVIDSETQLKIYSLKLFTLPEIQAAASVYI